ncbi:MAG TPA: DUF4177 domain-containing protein, partial [Pirellulales bacterium]
MPAYENAGGESGIASYEAGPGHIRVTFKDGWSYLYTDLSTGRDAVEEMKARAAAGRGLNTYISQHVGGRYATRRHASETPLWEYRSQVVETLGIAPSAAFDAGDLDTTFNALGAEGWELVSVVPMDVGSVGTARLVATFKR